MDQVKWNRVAPCRKIVFMIRIESEYSLLGHNTFGLDVSCRSFVEYDNEADLVDFIAKGRLKGCKWLHLGGGSNMLFVAPRYDGVVLHSRISGISVVSGEDASKVYVRVGAGVVWDDFVSWCVEQNYCGVENLSSIPGEVGASPVQNIGAYGVEAKDVICKVETVSAVDGSHRVFNTEECEFGYRSSFFKRSGEYIVTYVTFALSRPQSYAYNIDYGNLRSAVESFGGDVSAFSVRNAVISIRDAKLPKPSEIGSAGSFFKNPVVDVQVAEKLKRQYQDMPSYNVDDGVKIPAGWLIEQCGWKGKTKGHAGVYEKQALVLVNRGGATGNEIFSLANEIISSVKERYGIDISPEVCIIR